MTVRHARRGSFAPRLLLAALLLSSALPARLVDARDDSDPAARFAAANAALAAGRAAEAAAGYRQITASDGVSADLLLNLGIASFHAGDVGGAILAWERALLLAPRQSEVLANLRLVRHEANLPVEEPDLARWLVAQLSLDGWATAVLAALSGLGFVVLASLLRSTPVAGRRRVPREARLVALALLAVAAGSTAAWLVRLGELDRGVVLGTEPFLRVAPYESAGRSTPLQPGQIVALERRLPGFALVRTSDGRAGWVETGSIERIVPTSAPDAVADTPPARQGDPS